MCFRTKWKRQTAVGLELLAEAGNFAAVQRMLQTNPYWASYHPHVASLLATSPEAALYYRNAAMSSAYGPPRPAGVGALPSRMFLPSAAPITSPVLPSHSH